MREPLSPWWNRVEEAAQLLASRLNALVTRAAREGVYSPPPGAPAPRRRRQPASLRHLAEVIRTHRLAPGTSVDKDGVAAVLAGNPQSVADPVLVLAVARAAHLIARVPLERADADRLVVAAAHVSALIDAAREADERAPHLVPVPRRPADDSRAEEPRPTEDSRASEPRPAEPVIIEAYYTTRRPGRRRALIAGILGALVLAGSAAVVGFRDWGAETPPAAVTSPAPAAGAR